MNQSFNSNTLANFNKAYKLVIDESDITGNEVALRESETVGYKFKKSKKIYFLLSEHIDKLPLKIKSSKRLVQGSDVYHYVVTFSPLRIQPNNTMDFRDLVDKFCNYKHTNKIYFTLYKILCIAAYVSRVNWRLATPPAFGKDSVVDAIRDLTNNAARIDKATPAKLEYVLTFPFILCNEVASLTKEEKRVFKEFGLSAGAKQNKYTKSTRKSKGTKEVYDISDLSLCFTYNNAKYYQAKGGKSFDESFEEQFLNRFIPFAMEGYIDVAQFKKQGEIDFEAEAEKYKPLYLDILAKLEWLKENAPDLKYQLSENFTFQKSEKRWESDFYLLCAFISHYVKDKIEFTTLTQVLYESHQKYLREELPPEQLPENPLMQEVVIK